MAEYSKEKLYFLKMPKDFFQGHYMRALEGLPNGKEYELMYLKLMLESVAYNGWLRLSEGVAYSAEMIAGITNTPLDTVIVGMQVLEGFGLITRNSDGSLFLSQVPQLTASTTVSAQKKQEQIARRQGVEKIPPSFHQDNKRLRELESNRETREEENKDTEEYTKEDTTSLHSVVSKKANGGGGWIPGVNDDELF